MRTIQTVGVVGAGQMGNGIAQVAAQSGYDVVLSDISDAAIERGMNTIRKSLGKLVSSDKSPMTQEEADTALARISTSTDTSIHASADLVVEAVSENMELKLQIFDTLMRVTRPDTILATNTSSLSITALAAKTDRPDKVIGMHFMNPVPIMKLVEVIPGLATSDETREATLALAQAMGKTTVLAKDIPGFIVNRVLMPYINEAVQALYEGIGTVEDIDTAMKLGTNVPMGPLKLADYIGIDTCEAIMEVVREGLGGDSKYRTCPLLSKYVEAGWLGRKTGKGFYNWER